MIAAWVVALLVTAPPEATPKAVEQPAAAPKSEAAPSSEAAPEPAPKSAPEVAPAAAAAAPAEPLSAGQPPAPVEAKSAPESPTPAKPEEKEDEGRKYFGRPLPPERFRVDLFLAGGTQRIADRAYRAFDDDPTLAGITVLVRADGRLGASDFFLGAGVGYRSFVTNNAIFDLDVDTRLVAQDLTIFGRFSYAPLEGLDVFAEAGSGPSFVDVHVNGGMRSHQREVLALFDALGGLALSMPRRWLPSDHCTAGIDVGVGYTLRSKFGVQPEPVVEDDAITTTSVRFGDVRLHGLLWRAGLFVRFL